MPHQPALARQAMLRDLTVQPADIGLAALGVAGLITPVPGGIGPVTVAMLLENTVIAARTQRGMRPMF